jgi:hypothetical protein
MCSNQIVQINVTADAELLIHRRLTSSSAAQIWERVLYIYEYRIQMYVKSRAGFAVLQEYKYKYLYLYTSNATVFLFFVSINVELFSFIFNFEESSRMNS